MATAAAKVDAIVTLGLRRRLTLIPLNDIISGRMNKRHRDTLTNLFAEPVQATIPWRDIESLLKSLGAEISEGRGSRVRIALNSFRAVFHRPHPQKETDKGAVRSMRKFLETAGITCP